MQRRPAVGSGKASTGGRNRPAPGVDLNFAALDKVLAKQRAKQERQQQQQVQQRNKDVQQGPKHAAADAAARKEVKKSTKPPPAAVSLPDLTPEEADDLFDQVAQQVVARWKDDESDDEDSVPSSKPSSQGGFKGFGVPPTPSTSKATRSEQSMLSTTSSNSKQPSTKVEASQSMPVASSSSTSSSSSGGSSDGSRNRTSKTSPSQPSSKPRTAPARKGPLRIFLFSAEAKKTQEAIQQAGLQGQVEVTTELKDAHAVVATKVARDGTHHRLQQGERMAANAGLPFLCVGRNMSAANLSRSLADLLSPQPGSSRPSQGQGHPASTPPAPVMSPREMKASGLWKEQMLSSLGLSSDQHRQLRPQVIQEEEEQQGSQEPVLAGAK